jgi:Arc/MetJ family transcription regulator
MWQCADRHPAGIARRVYIMLPAELYRRGDEMPVTSVNIDSDLLDSAKAAYHVRTNREAITLALEDAVQRQRQLEALRLLSTIPIDPHPSRIEYE